MDARAAKDRSGERWLIQALAAVVAGVGLLFLLGVPASAQAPPGGGGSSCDPAYGCQPPPSSSPPAPACSVSSKIVAPGQSLTARIERLTPGTEVTLLFDGSAVGRATATTRPGQTSASADVNFVVPSDARPGQHTLVFSGAGVSCDATGGTGLTVAAGVAVLGESTTRVGAGTGVGGSLARTGITIAVLLAVAVALLAVGWRLVQGARRRRRRVEIRQPNYTVKR